ncbi:MAG: ABC transporter ATP-binding protein [Magnetovibrionaceae bacterium]
MITRLRLPLNMGQSWALLDGDAKRTVVALFFAIASLTLLELLSLGLILPLIQVVLLGEEGGPWQPLVDGVRSLLPTVSPAVSISVSFAVVFAIKNLALLGLIFWINRSAGQMAARYMARLLSAYLEKPLVYHLSRNSADLVRNILTNVGLSFEVIRLQIMVMLESLVIIGILGLLVAIAPWLSIGAGVLLVGFVLVYFRFAGPVLRRWGSQSMGLEAEVIKLTNDTLGSIRDVKLLNAIPYFSKRMAATARVWWLVNAKRTAAVNVPRLLVETLVMVGAAGIVAGFALSGESQAVSLPLLALFGMAGLRVMPSLNRMLLAASEIRARWAYVEEIKTELAQIASGQDLAGVSPASAGQKIDFTKALDLKDLHYTYPAAERASIEGVSLSLSQGETIGIVGASGAGKSTLMDLMLGLLAAEKGSITLDGEVIELGGANWFDTIGFVPQTISIIDDTLRRNVAFGVEDEDINQAALTAALKLAQLDDVVRSLPDGLETVLGEGGVRLSGGQRQRIAIARALYRDPPILLFDEATAALDNETEREISQAIHRLGGERTIVIIAHRLSTVRDCDRLVVMDQGRIVDQGSYDALLENSPLFQRLARGTT